MNAKAVVVALLATTAFVASPAPSVSALFTASAVGSVQSVSQSVSQPVAPVAVAVAREVTVSWPAATLSAGTPVTGYVVRRYSTANVLQTVLNDCITVTTTSCVEHNVPVGTWRYTVQARLGSWDGPESAASSSITVASASFALTSSAPITALPQVVTGTISQFTLGATLTYRLDSTSGTVLTGSPATVTSSTSMGVSVTLPAGTSDAPHSIFVVDSTGVSAAAAVNIVFAPVVQTVQMRDVNGNGKVDSVVVTFDEALATYSAGIAPWTLANVPSGGTLFNVTVSGSTATLAIAEGGGAANTAVGTFTVALAANASGIRDVNNHTASFAARAPTDAAPPAVQALTAIDSNANGKVDRVSMSFSEALAPYSAGNTVWTLANVPSAGTLASVGVTSPTVTLTITEGAGAVDTSVGAFTVSLAAGATGIRDAVGNQASFSTAPADGMTPLRQSQQMFDDNVDGKVDRVLVTFSEPLAPLTAAPTVFSLAAAPSGATVNSVAIAGNQAAIALNQGAGAANTAVGSFTVALAANAGGIRDAAGNQASYAAATVTDRAAPALVGLNLLDNSANGKVDRVTAVFSETPSTYSAGITPLTLANVPSSGTPSTATLSGTTLTIALTEGAGAADTAVGSMTVAMATSATGIRDAAGNLASFAARTPVDLARPVPMTVADANVGTNGRAEAGDSVSITFSEALGTASVPTSTSLTLTDPVGTGSDTLSITGVTNGARSTGGANYMTLDGGVATWTSSVVLTNLGRTLTVTFTGTCTGSGCGSLGTQATNGTFSFVSATTLTDVSGNIAATTARSTAIRLF